MGYIVKGPVTSGEPIYVAFTHGEENENFGGLDFSGTGCEAADMGEAPREDLFNSLLFIFLLASHLA